MKRSTKDSNHPTAAQLSVPSSTEEWYRNAKEPFWGAQGLQAHSLGCSRGVLLSKSLWHRFMAHLCAGCHQLPPTGSLQAQPHSGCTCNTRSFIPLNKSLEKLIRSSWRGWRKISKEVKQGTPLADHAASQSCAVTHGDWTQSRGLTCFLVHWRTVMGEPLWSARTWMVIPVRGLLTATIPSLPPDKIISPVGRGDKRMGHFL